MYEKLNDKIVDDYLDIKFQNIKVLSVIFEISLHDIKSKSLHL